MKAKTKTDEDVINDFAGIALGAILKGVYSHPALLEMMESIARDNKHSINQEIAQRAWSIAGIMLKDKALYISQVENPKLP